MKLHRIILLIAFSLVWLVASSQSRTSRKEKLSNKNKPDPEQRASGKESPKTGEEQEENNDITENITFLNAANFDFENNINGSYLGKLNIFAPNISGKAYGVNAGIMRIKFNYRDTSNSVYLQENRLINPLDSIKHSSTYLREYNQFTSTRSNTVWSFYVQPMIRLWNLNETLNGPLKNSIYFHLHFELLVNKTNVTTNIQNLQRDTAQIDTAHHLQYIPYRPDVLIVDRTFLNGYFGVGLTADLDPFSNNNSRLFIQPTIGVTTTYPGWVSQDISSTVVTVAPTRNGTPSTLNQLKSSFFYLIRAEFHQKLSNNSQLVVGTDIRGLFPRFNPVYASYLGLNLNLNALINVFTGKDKKDPGKESGEDGD